MRCVIHTGVQRTGSTSIQRLLWGNRAAIAEHGFFVPEARGGQSQRGLAVLTELEAQPIRRHAGWRVRTQDDLHALQARVRAELSDHLRSSVDRFHTTILSNEFLATRPPRAIETLKELLGEYCDTFTIIVYLRRQDLQRVSEQKNRIKSFADPLNPFLRESLNYGEILDNWTAVFGQDAVRPIIFPDSADQPRDLIDSFLHAAGLDRIPASEIEKPERQNTSWDARSLELMVLLNEFIPLVVDGMDVKERRILGRLLNGGFPGEPIAYWPRRSDAEAYAELAAESNERVRARWFPHQATLFHGDFSMYPQTPTTHLTTRDCAYMLAELAKIFAARVR